MKLIVTVSFVSMTLLLTNTGTSLTFLFKCSFFLYFFLSPTSYTYSV